MSHIVDFATYSTSEQVVGTWIDGSTIYRQVITGTASSTSESVVVSPTVSFLKAEVYLMTGNDRTTTYYSGSSDYFRWFLRAQNNTSTIELRSSNYNYNYMAIIYYTKPS